GLLARFPQRGGDGVLVAVAGAARQAPRAAVVAPPSAFLHEQVGGAVAVVVDGEQAGGAVDAPVLVAVRAHGPAVPILRRHTSHLVATGAAPPDGGVFREGFERARRTARTAATVVH